MTRRTWGLAFLAAAAMVGCGLGGPSNPAAGEGGGAGSPAAPQGWRDVIHGPAPSVDSDPGSCAGDPASCTMSFLSAGSAHTVARKSDGTVWSWGNDVLGQLGDGGPFTGFSATPVQAIGLGGVTAVATNVYHTVALKSDGTVWDWGYNLTGQIGDGTTTDRDAPFHVPGLTGMIGVSAGWYHTVALKSDGTVWDWGGNGEGQLGDGTTDDRPDPVQVGGVTGIVAIAAGWYHTLALKGDGTVWGWGYNNTRQLGDGTTTERTTPVQVIGLSGVIAIAAAPFHNAALKSDGTVWCWGYNATGELGDGTTEERTAPVQVVGLDDVIAVSANDHHTMALKSDGTVWGWGENYYHQLGNDTVGDYSPTPVRALGIGGIVAVAAGDQHSMVLKSDGTVWGWGANDNGQLGDGETADASATPVQVIGLNLAEDACHSMPVCGALTGMCAAVEKSCPASECHLAGTCDPSTGQCNHPAAPNGAPCSDGNACTSGDKCYGGACQPGHAVRNGAHCDDDDACTQHDICIHGICEGKQPKHCCSGLTCDPATGVCE
ncbi:MAG: hypothetical protein U0441_38630 [Polyangiaceae bacterium]